MSDTQMLLTRISALRQRLSQMPQRGSETPPAMPARQEPPPPSERVQVLEARVTAGSRSGALLDSSLRRLEEKPVGGPDVLPTHLTARARRLVGYGRDLLIQLRSLADEPLLQRDEGDPLAVRYRETVAMTDTALRTVMAYPNAASGQLHLCEGLEGILNGIAERLGVLQAAVGRRRHEHEQVDTLARLLVDLDRNETPPAPQHFLAMAETLLTEAQQAMPLRFLQDHTGTPARFIACHGLNVAQVVARLVRHDPELRSRPLEPILAALVHDAGMLRVPVDVYLHAQKLDDTQRRAIESHTRHGAEMAARLLPDGKWLAEAAAGHHEHLDGMGYPSGLRELQIAPLLRLLSVCDVYAALCSPRPHRPAREPRAALTDTLLMAEKGRLDGSRAERLLLLSFYPTGSVVELADGAIGIVATTPVNRRDVHSPSRPVVTLLLDGEGKPFPLPRTVDLSEAEGLRIVRTLSAEERRRTLGKRYPELA